MYFKRLSQENVSVLCEQFKEKINKMKINWSFEWFQYIKDHQDKDWDYNLMCANLNVTWELIQAYPHLFHDYKEMCKNHNINWDIIQTFPETTEIYEHINCNPNITLDLVNQYPENNWQYHKLAANPSFTFDEMKKDWNWKEYKGYGFDISRNPNITWRNVIEHL